MKSNNGIKISLILYIGFFLINKPVIQNIRILLVMKISNLLLKENFEFDDSGKVFTAPKISVSDLNSLQMRTLKRLHDGIVDLDSASDKESEIIMDLIELGLVDVDGNVNASGDELSQPADLNSKYHTSDTSEIDDNGSEDDDYDDYEDDDPLSPMNRRNAEEDIINYNI